MLIFFLNLAVEYNKSRDMNNEVLERLKEEYGEDDDLIQLYEDWGNTPYLHEIYRILDEHSSDWVLERELGSWAAEFILDILQERRTGEGEQMVLLTLFLMNGRMLLLKVRLWNFCLLGIFCVRKWILHLFFLLLVKL